MATHFGGGVALGSNTVLREQAKKRREQEARRPTAQAPAERPLFGPPIQVKRSRDPTHEKLSDLFGQYEVAKEYMTSDKMFGADLQPPTPLPPSSHFSDRHPTTRTLPTHPSPSSHSKSAQQHRAAGAGGGGQVHSLQHQQHHHQQQQNIPNGSASKSEPNRRGVFEQFKEQKQQQLQQQQQQQQQQQRPDDTRKGGGSGAASKVGGEGASSLSSSAVMNGLGSDRFNTAQMNTSASVKPSSSSSKTTGAVDPGRHHNRLSENHRWSSEVRPDSSQPCTGSDKMATVNVDRKRNSDRTLTPVSSGNVQSSAGAGPGSQSATAQIRDMISGSGPSVAKQGRSSEKLTVHIPGSSSQDLDQHQQQFDEFFTDLLKKVSVPPPLTAIDTPTTNNNFTNAFQFNATAAKSTSGSKDARLENHSSSQGKVGRHSLSTDNSSIRPAVNGPRSGSNSNSSSNNGTGRPTPNRHASPSPPPISPVMVSPPPHGSDCQTIRPVRSTLLDTDLVLSSDDDEDDEPSPILGRERCSNDLHEKVPEQRLQPENERPALTKKSNVGESKSTATTLSSTSTSQSSDVKVPNNKCRGAAEPVPPAPHVRHHPDNGGLSSSSRGERVRSRAYVSSSSESGESSDDDSDEDSDTNSSDDDDDEEENVPTGNSGSRVKSNVKDTKKVMSFATDADDDKQGKSSWGLTNFVPVKEKSSQVPLYASTTPEPVLPAPPSYSSLGHMPTPPEVQPGLQFEDDFDSICSNLLSDDNRALMSPLAVDKSGLLEGLSHDILSQDINDVFDSVIKCNSSELPELTDLDRMSKAANVLAEAETHIVSPPAVMRASLSDDTALTYSSSAQRPISPPGLVFCSNRPSVVVKLRRLPSRNYRSNCVAKKSEPVLVDSRHSNPFVKVEQLPDAVAYASSSSTLRRESLSLENSKSSINTTTTTSKTSKSKSKPSTTSTPASASVACNSSTASSHKAKKIGAASQQPNKVDVQPREKLMTGSDSSYNEDVRGQTKRSSGDQKQSKTHSAEDGVRLKQDNTAVVVGVAKKQRVKQNSVSQAEEKTMTINNSHKQSTQKSSRSNKEHCGKRKSDTDVDGVDAKRFCDKNRTATYKGRDKSYQSPDESDSGGDMKATSVGEIDCCDTASASHLLTPPPSVVTSQTSNVGGGGGGSCVVDGRAMKSFESHNQPTTKHTDRRFMAVNECDVSVTSISQPPPQQPYLNNVPPPSINIKTENEPSRLCNGRTAGLDHAKEAVVGSQSSAQTDLPIKEKRPVENVDGKPLDRRKDDGRIPSLEENRIMPSEHYLEQAKKLKHCGDAKLERFAKMLTYLESVLMFARHGHALEYEKRSAAQIYNLYRETLKFCQSVCDTRFITCSSSDLHKLKLLVVGHRLQSFLHLKLYSLKRSEIQAIKRAVDDNLQNPTLKPLQVPSPYNAGAAAVLTDTLSPISSSSHLTPSPAGSVSSVGSVGSQNSDHCLSRLPLTNGHTKLLTVSQPVYSVMLSYISHVNHLHDCHEHWNKADEVLAANPDVLEFFSSLDSQLGPLHFGSQLQSFVRYFLRAFELLQQLPSN